MSIERYGCQLQDMAVNCKTWLSIARYGCQMEPKHAWEEKINKTFIRVRQPQESPLMIGMDYAHIIQNRLLYN